MGSSLGTASLILSTSANKLYSGLDAAGNKIGGWAKQQTQQVQGSFGKLGGMLGSSLKGGVVGLVAGFGLGALTSGLEGTIDSIKELATAGRQAKSLGIASDQFMGLSNAFKKFGVEGEGTVKLFAKLGSKSVEAAQGNKQLEGVFQTLGLSGQQLAGMTLDQQFIAVADALSKVPNAGQQAQLAMKLFEEEGIKILPMLQKGGGEIQKFIDKQKSMGLALGQTDMNKLMRAQEALPKLGQAFEGMKNKMLVAMAPVIELIAGKLTAVVEFLQPIFEKVGRAFATHWGIIADILGEVVGGIVEVIEIIGKWIGELIGVENVSMTVEEIVTGVWKAIAIGASYCWDVIKAGAGAVAYAASFIVDGFGLVVDVFKEIITLAKELPDELRPDWLDGLIAGTDKFSATVSGTAEKMRGWGKGTFDNFGKSADDVNKWFDKRGQKKPGTLEEQKAGALVNQQENKPATYTAVAAALKGSKEEASILAKASFANIMNPQLEAQKKQLDAQKKANDLIQDVVDAVKGIDLGFGIL